MFRAGFGGKTCNYWLGNELLHQLTKDGQYRVRFDVQALSSGQWYWAEYDTFFVYSEATRYRLTVGGYSGNAGDAMAYHNGMNFTSYDSDNDEKSGNNCAANRGGGFWYKNCGRAQLTAANDYGGIGDGHCWKPLPEPSIKLQTSRVWLMCP